MQFPVWRLLGLAWINSKHVPEITDIGRRFVEAKKNDNRRELPTMQLHRYQFYNPSAARHFNMFRTFPVLSLYRLLSQTDWKLSRDEFLLFGTRIRNFNDTDKLAELVGEWRELTQPEREQLLAAAKTNQATAHVKGEEGTTWTKVSQDRTYIEAVLSILPTIQLTDGHIEVPKAAQRNVHRLVLASAAESEFVEYESEQDWLAVYGQAPSKDRWSRPRARAFDARAYYESIGRIDAATDAYAREDKSRSPKAVEEYRKVQVLERALEDILEHNLGTLETGLKLVGRQYATAVGPIDLLAQDPEGIYVVIELKRGRTSDRVIGQVARYMTWVVQRLAQGRESKVRAIIVGRDFDRNFEAAIAQLKRTSSYTFDLRVLFEKWPQSN